VRPERNAIYFALAMLAGSVVLSLGLGGLIHALLHFSVRDVRMLVRHLGPFGAPAVVLMIAVVIVFIPVPTIPIEVVAGIAYGALFGSVLVFIGHMIGALTAFFLARRFGRPLLARWLGQRTVARLDTFSNGGTGFRYVFFLRLLPLFDFKLVSYACGLTDISPRTYAVATAAGIYPPILILATIGSTAAVRPREAALFAAVYSLAIAGTIAYFLVPRRRRVVHTHHSAGEAAEGGQASPRS
jgi:uncharacterized membrane protein YdjX (TVP38/TMEM64 family)